MNLYDIHTHHIPEYNLNQDYNIISILNIYLFNFNCEKKLIDSANIYFSSGIHPWYIDVTTFERNYNELCEIAKHPKCVAIGEIGLDKINGVNLEIQKEAFEKQVLLAQEMNKPLIIHCVKAWDELINLYKKIKPKKSWIIHGFRGNSEQARQLVRLGFKLSFGDHFNEGVIRNIPKDSLFIETDTSKLSLLSNYHKIAELGGLSLGEVVNFIEFNVFRTFTL